MSEESKPNSSPLPARDSVTQLQVVTLLGIVKQLECLAVHSDDEGCGKLDGGAKAAVEATLIKVCDRLDAILDDGSRWTLAQHDGLYDAMLASQLQAAASLKEQAEAFKYARSPAALYKPHVVAINNEFIAVWGDLEGEGSYLLGRGPTPAAALADFNLAFERAPRDQQILIAEASEPQPNSEPKPKKARRKAE